MKSGDKVKQSCQAIESDRKEAPT